ncbi:MAG: amino acid permease [Methanoregula sp.]|jgi:APA family basic amino acid/polyamine antiporter
MKGASIFDHSMFKKKSMEHMEATAKSTHALKRVLKPFDLVMLGIGGIIGTGIFVLSGVAAGLHAGNALPFSFIIAGTVCLFAALYYAELSTMIPVPEVPIPTVTRHWAKYGPGSLAGHSSWSMVLPYLQWPLAGQAT